MKPILVSGIQTSGRLHIGNYLGALKNFVDLQNSGKYRCYFFLADLHSLTEFPVEGAKEERRRVLDLAANFLAAGLDPKKSVIYQQSQIPAHSELAWIFNTITPMGELERMTQFKDKAGLQEIFKKYTKFNRDDPRKFTIELDSDKVKGGGFSRNEDIILNFVREYGERSLINSGLLMYPVLMAADILLYDAAVVPVGDDQDQHLELTRTVARKFNSKFGKLFIEPKSLHTPTPRVMSLKDPSKKMSKSRPETCLFLDDSPNEIEKKIMSATTDSGSEVRFEPRTKPGISNLLDIFAGISGKSVATLEKEFAGKNYGEFKRALAETLIKHLAPFRTKKVALMKKPATMKKVLTDGSRVAAKVANAKIALVKRAVGVTL